VKNEERGFAENPRQKKGSVGSRWTVALRIYLKRVSTGGEQKRRMATLKNGCWEKCSNRVPE